MYLVSSIRSVTLYVVSGTGCLLQRSQRELPAWALSMKYPVIGEPPSLSGAFQVSSQDSLVTSVGSGADGGPGGSANKVVSTFKTL